MNHSKYCDKNPNKKQNLEKQQSVIKINREKITEEVRKRINKGVAKAWNNGKYDERKCSRLPMGDLQKKSISNSRKEWMKNNPEKHPWKKSKFKSEPCEHLKRILKANNLKFEEEWTPLTERYFSIDIAFIDKKIGIEVNGEQHYNRNGSLRDYYQKRHDLIEENGWKLIEIHYAKVYNDEEIKKILMAL